MHRMKVVYLCAIMLSYLSPSAYGQSLAELAKMAGVDLKEIGGAEHLADDDSPVKAAASLAANMSSKPAGSGSTPTSSSSNSLRNMASSLGVEIPPEFATAEAASKPSCGNCGKPGCPECAGKLGIGMTPDYGGQAMASGMEGMGGFPGMGGMEMAGMGYEDMSALGSAGFSPSLNGFGGNFGGYGAPSASFQSAYSPYGGGMMNAFGGGFETEMNPMGGGGYATFPLHAPIEPYPVRGSRGGRSRRPRPQPQEEHQESPPPPPPHQQHHYEGPAQEHGGYEQHGPPSPQGGYQEEQHGPSHQEYDSGSSGHHPSSGSYQGRPAGNSGYDYEQ